MEIGKTYNVYYKDVPHPRKKILRYLDTANGLLYFFNDKLGIEEFYPLVNIIRIEGTDIKNEKPREKEHNNNIHPWYG